MRTTPRPEDDAANHCPACDKKVILNLSNSPGDARCPHCGHLLWFVISRRARGVTVVNIAKRRILDESEVRQFGKELAGLVVGPRQLILNFAMVEALSSAALGELIALQKSVTRSGGKLLLFGIQPQIMQVFKITQLNKLLDIHESEAGALHG